MCKKIGYARVSTKARELNLQIHALMEYCCESKLIFTDKISGAKANRPLQ
jgi:DNA invertase Pin-like site-specific DNA recombinase